MTPTTIPSRILNPAMDCFAFVRTGCWPVIRRIVFANDIGKLCVLPFPKPDRHFHDRWSFVSVGVANWLHKAEFNRCFICSWRFCIADFSNAFFVRSTRTFVLRPSFIMKEYPTRPFIPPSPITATRDNGIGAKNVTRWPGTPCPLPSCASWFDSRRQRRQDREPGRSG